MKEYVECVGRLSVALKYQSYSKNKSHLSTCVCNTSGHLSFHVKTLKYMYRITNQIREKAWKKQKQNKAFKKLSAALGELPPPLLLQNCSIDFNSGSLECDVSHVCLWKY